MRILPELGRDARMWASRALNRSLAPPDWLSVNLTLRCNLSCVMCTTCYDAPEMTTREVLDLVDQAATWGVKVFNPLGGEPFVRSDLEDILAQAARRDLHVTLTTNATLITPARAARIAAIPPEKLHVNISIDGLESVHDEVRGKGSFTRALTGYHNLRAADAAAGNPRRKVCANSILHRKNLAQYLELVDFLEAEAFDGVQVLNLFRDDEDADVGGMWFDPASLPALEAVCEALASRAVVLNRASDLRLVPRYYRDGLRPLEAKCWAGWKELYVNADGTAIMCDGELDFLAGRFGSVRESTLRELWASDALRARRSVVKACTTPCLQNCYLRRESDSARVIARDLIETATAPLRARVARHLPLRTLDETLTLELSDVPDDPVHPRTRALFARSPVTLPELWADPSRFIELRDRHYLDFGRGFMGVEMVRHVLDAISRARLRFRDVVLGWRGEPLLHPDFDAILALVPGARVATTGRMLGDRRVERATLPTRGPTISWDGRVTVSPADVRLEHKIGDVLREPFGEIWKRYASASSIR